MTTIGSPGDLPVPEVIGSAAAGSALSCPECGGAIHLRSRTLLGEIVSCGECLAELEVLGLDPPEVALAPEVEEDWGE